MILDQDFQMRSYMYILVAQRLQIFRMSNLEVNKAGSRGSNPRHQGYFKRILRNSEELPELSNSSSEFIQKSKWITCLFLYFKIIFDSVVIEDISFYEQTHLYSTLVFQNVSFQNIAYHSVLLVFLTPTKMSMDFFTFIVYLYI